MSQLLRNRKRGRSVARAAIDVLEPRRLLADFTVDPGQPVSGDNFHAIADAIAAAAGTAETDDVVTVVAGVYVEAVLIDTPLSLRGAQFGVDPRPGRAGEESVLQGQIAVTAAGVSVDGWTVADGATTHSAGESAGLFVDAAGATLSNLILSGGAGAGLLTSANDVGGLVLSNSVVSDWTSGATIRGGGAVSLAGNVVRDNTAMGVRLALRLNPGASAVGVAGNAFDNPGVPQLSLEGGDAGLDEVTVGGNAVSLRGGAAFIALVEPTPLAVQGDNAFELFHSLAEDGTLSIDLNVDGSGLAPPLDTTGLVGEATPDGDQVDYVPPADFHGTTDFGFTLVSGASGVARLTVTPVNDAPVLTVPPDAVSAIEDTPLTFPPGLIDVTDVDAVTLTVRLELASGTGTLSVGGTGGMVTPSEGDRVQTIAGTVAEVRARLEAVTYAPAENFFGSTTVQVTVTDDALPTPATASLGFTLLIEGQNDAPTSTPIPPLEMAEGASQSWPLAGYFDDADVGDVLTYALGGAPAFVGIDAETGLLTASPTGTDAGVYLFDVIADDGDATTSQQVQLTVTDVPNAAPVFINLPAAVTLPENAIVPVFTVEADDPDDNAIAYSIVGGNEAGLFAIDPATGVVTLVGPLDFETQSSYTLTIRATDDGWQGPEFAEAALGITVEDMDDPTSVWIDAPAHPREGQLLTFTAHAVDQDADATLTYQWFVDGVEQTGLDDPELTLTFDDEGSHVIAVSVTGGGGAPAVDSVSIDVEDAPTVIPLSTSSPGVDEASSFTLTIGTLTDAGAGDVAEIGQLAIDWGYGDVQVINAETNLAAFTAILAGVPQDFTHVYLDGKGLARTITVSAWTTQYAYTASTGIVVNNVAPTGTFVALTPSVPAGEPAFVNWFGQSDVSPDDLQRGLRYTYAIDQNEDGVLDVGDTPLAGDGTYNGSVINSSYVIPAAIIHTPGVYKILGLLLDKDGSPFLTRSVTITVTPSPLRVLSLGGDASGFTVVFNRPIDAAPLNLYDGAGDLGAADIVVNRVGGQPLTGSLVMRPGGDGFEFIASGGIIASGAYAVWIRSGPNGVQDLAGGALDGDDNGVPGGDYAGTFSVSPPGPVFSVPDFARGPGQAADILPGTPGSGLPVTVNTPVAISSVNFQLRYDASILQIRPPDTSDPNPANHVLDVVAGAGLPAGWAIAYAVAPGSVNISLTKTTPSAPNIAAGLRELVKVRAVVVDDPALYGRTHVMQFANVVVNGIEQIEATSDRAVHKVVFLGDANYDGTVNSGDAGIIQSVVLGTRNGFSSYPLIDPVIVADSSRNRLVDSQDATNAALTGFTGGRPADVPAFSPISLGAPPGADPTFAIPAAFAAVAGERVHVPVGVVDDGRGVQSGAFRIEYDTALLDLLAANVLPGTLTASGWTILTNIDDAAGFVEIAFFSGTPIDDTEPAVGTLVTLGFDVAAHAVGLTPLTLAAPTDTPSSPTTFFDHLGRLLATSAVSGSIVIDTARPTVEGVHFAYAGTEHALHVTFSESVADSISAASFELLNLTTGTTVSVVLVQTGVDGRVYRLDFTGTGGVAPHVLIDGNYRLRIKAADVRDLAGNAMAADVDSTFFFMNADANHDRAVNFDDLLTLAQNYGRSGDVGFSTGDFNYDNAVDFNDLLLLAQRYGASLAALVAPARAPTEARPRSRPATLSELT